MQKCNMYYFNITRLVESCPFVDVDFKEGLVEYLYELEVDLNCVNIDDLVVNGITYLSYEEWEELGEEKQEDYYIISEVDNGYYII